MVVVAVVLRWICFYLMISGSGIESHSKMLKRWKILNYRWGAMEDFR
ncbi:MAG: hypothetical protein LBD60_01560 [Puniceicoccales bacterium]|nr:hypothetical protein [Puniceicoccales bacterium]